MKIKLLQLSRLREGSVKITRIARGVFAGPKVSTCIEISEGHLKLAQFETTSEGKKLAYLFTRRVPSPEEGKIVKTLQAVLSELRTRGIILSCLPRHQVTVRYLKLPSANPRELEAMLDFQVTKQIPYPREETVYSYSVLGVDSGGYADILLAIVHQETVLQHLRILKACNLEPANVGFNALASCAWFLQGSPALSSPTLLIDVDTIYTTLSVVGSRGLLFTRAIKLGVEDFEAKEKISALASLEEEVGLSLSTYAKESPESPITRVVLTGATSVLDMLKDALEKEFTYEFEIKLPLEKIKFKRDVLEENWFDMHRVSLNAVLGLGLEAEASYRLNLLPASVKETRMKQQRQRQVIFSFVLSGLILLSAVGFLAKKLYEKSSTLHYLNRELRKVSSRAQDLEAKKRNLELIRELFSQRSICLDIILELHRIVPAEISLLSFDFEDRKGLVLRGTSKEMAAVFRFVAILDKAAYFANSQVKFVKKRAGTEELTDFEVYCPLKKETK